MHLFGWLARLLQGLQRCKIGSPELRDFAKGAEFKITKPNAPFKHRGQWMDTGGRACQHSKKGMTEWAIIALVPIIEAPKQRAAPPPIICSDETGPVLRIKIEGAKEGR